MTLSPRIELVIFDCDGVLVDSEAISAEVLVEVLATLGIGIDTDHVYGNYTGKSFPKVAAMLSQDHPEVLPADFEALYRAALFRTFATRLRPTLGLLDMLSDLDCRKCIATSSTPVRLQRSLALCGLTDHFGPHLFTASQVANGKPAPDLFEFAAQSMNTNPANCLVIEDSEVGLQAALAARMTTWRYTGGAHLIHAKPPTAPDLRAIRSFDNWTKFYQMAPELRRQGA